MKNLIIGIIIGIILAFCTAAFCQYGINRDLPFYSYHEGRYPDREDSIKAEINKAIALQKIVEEGITLNIIFKNKLEVDKKE